MMNNTASASTNNTAMGAHSGQSAIGDADATTTAFAFLSELAGEVSSGTVDLPCFPEVVLRVRRVLANPKTSPEALVNILGSEARLASKIMQVANSAAFNPSNRTITDLKTAVVRLGAQCVQSSTMSYAMQQMKSAVQLRPIAKELGVLWKKSIAIAAVSKIVAQRSKVSPDEAFFAGLVSAIGRLYILARAVGRPELATNDAFMDLIAGWHASIGKAVLENWKFSDEIVAAVGAQEEYDRPEWHIVDLTDVLVASVILAEALNQTESRSISIEGVTAFASLGMDVKACEEVLAKSEESLTALHAALGL